MNKKRIYTILNLCVLIIMIGFMYKLALGKSFWYDELDWTIKYLDVRNIFEMISSLSKSVYNMPFFYIILFPLYKILPYGETWLLIPNFIAVILGIYILRKIGEKIGGIKFGFIVQLVAATSTTVINQCGLEFRPYAFLFCLSTWTFFRYITKLEFNNKKNIVLYTISLVLLSYTHYFGCLIIMLYFLYDLYLYIRYRNKYKLSIFLPYFIAGILLLPWFLSIIGNNLKTNYMWTAAPKFKEIINIFNFLLSYNTYSKYLFALSIITLILTNKRKKYKYLNICIISIIFVIATIFIYSKYIKPDLSLFVSRYFVVIIPHIFIISSIFPYVLLNLKAEKNKNKNIVIRTISLVIVLFIFIKIGYNYIYIYNNNSSIFYKYYKDVSNIIEVREKQYSTNSALLENRMGTGFLIYYFEKKGIPLPNNVFIYNYGSFNQIIDNKKRCRNKYITQNDLLKYDTLYLYFDNINNNDSLLIFINNNYKLIEKRNKLKLHIYKRYK